MPCLPRIDQPCPLGRAEQAQLGGFCTRCEKTVHVLDAMSADQRRSLLQRASGPICVSYRVSAGLGAALALSLAAAPAVAALPGSPASQLPVTAPPTSSRPIGATQTES